MIFKSGQELLQKLVEQQQKQMEILEGLVQKQTKAFDVIIEKVSQQTQALSKLERAQSELERAQQRTLETVEGLAMKETVQPNATESATGHSAEKPLKKNDSPANVVVKIAIDIEGLQKHH